LPGVTGALAKKEDLPQLRVVEKKTAMKSFVATAPRPALAGAQPVPWRYLRCQRRIPVDILKIMVIWAPDALEYAVKACFRKALRALVARAGAACFPRPMALPVMRGVPGTKSQKSVPYYIYYVLRGVF
jgi:hypothetical protein